MTLRFEVLGVPMPCGSKTVSRHGAVYEAVKGAKPWREAVRWAAREAYRGPLLTGPVHVGALFIFPRPKYHFNKKGVRPGAPHFVSVKPDLDKLERNLLDALTGIVWRDDALVVTKTTRKLYGEHAGVRVSIEPYEPHEIASVVMLDAMAAQLAPSISLTPAERRALQQSTLRKGDSCR